VSNGADIEAREDMAISSTLGGIALANSKLGAVHGFAGVLGGMFEYAPHGALCATLLPATFSRTAERLAELAEKGGDHEGGGINAQEAQARLERMREVSRLVTGSGTADWPEGVAWLKAIVCDLKVPGLNALCKLEARGGMSEEDKKACVAATAGASSTKGNPIRLSDDDLREILEASC
jgi:alcohol dehydrogenase class IV